jgi:hypothetical protein
VEAEKDQEYESYNKHGYDVVTGPAVRGGVGKRERKEEDDEAGSEEECAWHWRLLVMI